MQEIVRRHKAAWEHDAYAFYTAQNGTPEALAQKILSDPVKALRKYAQYFDETKGLRVANICGSIGKKAVPLAVLGAEVTVFDLSQDNCRYAAELAAAANVPLAYEVCDIMTIDPQKYHGKVVHKNYSLTAFGSKAFCIFTSPFHIIKGVIL